MTGVPLLDWLIWTGAAFGAVTGILTALVKAKNWVESKVVHRLEEIAGQTKELKTNGGSHVADWAKKAADNSEQIAVLGERMAADIRDIRQIAGNAAVTAARAERQATETKQQVERIDERQRSDLRAGRLREAAYVAALREVGIDISQERTNEE